LQPTAAKFLVVWLFSVLGYGRWRFRRRLNGGRYPDSGSPAIVVDPSTDPEAVAAAWLAAESAEDCWAAFLGKASRDPDGASGRGG